jgi:hypothetical protein
VLKILEVYNPSSYLITARFFRELTNGLKTSEINLNSDNGKKIFILANHLLELKNNFPNLDIREELKFIVNLTHATKKVLFSPVDSLNLDKVVFLNQRASVLCIREGLDIVNPK